MHRSTSDIGSKVRLPESSGADQAQHHDQASFAPGSRAPMSVGPLDQSAFHSGEKIVLQKYVFLLFAFVTAGLGMGVTAQVFLCVAHAVFPAGSTTLLQSVQEQGCARL